MTTPQRNTTSSGQALDATMPAMVLVFRLSGEKFAIEVACVHEILDPIARTEVPHAFDYVPALINVRGAVVPLIDLRRRMGMKACTTTAEARVIVVELEVNGAPMKLALTADSVDEVIETDIGKLETIPDLGVRWPELFVLGVARHGDGLVVLLNPETLFRPDAETGGSHAIKGTKNAHRN